MFDSIDVLLCTRMSATDPPFESSNRKRKFEDEDSSDDGKRKFAKSELPSDLLRLADEVLLEILIKLDGESLHALGL